MTAFFDAAVVIGAVMLTMSWVIVIALCRAAAASDATHDAPAGSIDMTEFEWDFTRTP